MSCRCIYELLTMNGKGVSSEPQYYLLKWQTPHSNIKTFIQILHQVCFAGCFFNPVCCLVTSLRLSLNYKLILSSDHGTPAQWDIRGSQLSFIDLPASPTGFTVSFKENYVCRKQQDNISYCWNRKLRKSYVIMTIICLWLKQTWSPSSIAAASTSRSWGEF